MNKHFVLAFILSNLKQTFIKDYLGMILKHLLLNCGVPLHVLIVPFQFGKLLVIE